MAGMTQGYEIEWAITASFVLIVVDMMSGQCHLLISSFAYDIFRHVLTTTYTSVSEEVATRTFPRTVELITVWVK